MESPPRINTTLNQQTSHSSLYSLLSSAFFSFFSSLSNFSSISSIQSPSSTRLQSPNTHTNKQREKRDLKQQGRDSPSIFASFAFNRYMFSHDLFLHNKRFMNELSLWSLCFSKFSLLKLFRFLDLLDYIMDRWIFFICSCWKESDLSLPLLSDLFVFLISFFFPLPISICGFFFFLKISCFLSSSAFYSVLFGFHLFQTSWSRSAAC